jgi:hypothetical protein
MNDHEERGPWYLLTGIVIGIVIGIVYARFFQPVRYVDTTPASLRPDFKDQYRALIAAAYLSNGDLIRARARLELLEDPDAFRTLTEQAQRTLANEGASNQARALGMLAIALGQSAPGPAQVITQAPRNPTGTSDVSTPVELNRPSQNATLIVPASPEVQSSLSNGNPESENGTTYPATIAPESFVLSSKTEVCDQKLYEPAIQVEVSDRSGNPVQGVLVIITWAGGEERFYTGLKPEKGLGYADFELDPNFVYSARLGESGAPLGNLGSVSCNNSAGEVYWGALLLRYGQP